MGAVKKFLGECWKEFGRHETVNRGEGIRIDINFELSVLSMNAPLRVEKILGEIEGTGNFEYLFMRVSQYIQQHIMNGHLVLKISTEELITYLTTTYNGIEMCCIINHCYKKLSLMEWYVPKTQLKTLETTLYFLLGLED